MRSDSGSRFKNAHRSRRFAPAVHTPVPLPPMLARRRPGPHRRKSAFIFLAWAGLSRPGAANIVSGGTGVSTRQQLVKSAFIFLAPVRLLSVRGSCQRSGACMAARAHGAEHLGREERASSTASVAVAPCPVRSMEGNRGQRAGHQGEGGGGGLGRSPQHRSHQGARAPCADSSLPRQRRVLTPGTT